jgi:hypothetical protein
MCLLRQAERRAGDICQGILTALQKVILLCCTSSFVIAAYLCVRLIPQDLCALHNELFALPSDITYNEGIYIDALAKNGCIDDQDHGYN